MTRALELITISIRHGNKKNSHKLRPLAPSIQSISKLFCTQNEKIQTFNDMAFIRPYNNSFGRTIINQNKNLLNRNQVWMKENHDWFENHVRYFSTTTTTPPTTSSTTSSTSSSTLYPQKDRINTNTNINAFENNHHQLRIAKTLIRHVWPQGENNNPSSQKEAAKMRRRVLYSLGLMIGAKGIIVQVPFLFKYLVDTLPNNNSDAMSVATDMAMDLDMASNAVPVLPLAALLGYGISRATASGMQELRNAVFAHVAQDAIRR